LTHRAAWCICMVWGKGRRCKMVFLMEVGCD